MIEVPWECVHQSLAAKLKRKPYVNFVEGNWEGEVSRVSTTNKELPLIYHQYQQLALKVLNKHHHYESETQAYDALDKEEGIVECFGHWRYNDQYHLLLEWGSYDLEEFFQIHAPPTTTDGILQFWDAMGTIIQALSKIHRLGTLNHGSSRKAKTYFYGLVLCITP